MLGSVCEGAAVADLFAGSGGLGIEALSRGARSAVFFESHARAAATLKANLRAVGADGLATLVRQPLPRGLTGGPYGLVLMDPPWAAPVVPGVLEALVSGSFLAEGAVVVVESDVNRPPSAETWEALGLSCWRSRAYGDTLFTLLEHAAP